MFSISSEIYILYTGIFVLNQYFNIKRNPKENQLLYSVGKELRRYIMYIYIYCCIHSFPGIYYEIYTNIVILL